MKKGIILAAGLGKRMGGKYPKVLFPLKGKPLIKVLLNNVHSFFDEVIVVIGFKGDLVQKEIKKSYSNVKFVNQKKQLGTADAVKCAIKYINNEDDVFILNGDVPLLTAKTLNEIFATASQRGSDLIVGLIELEDPHGYGRVVMNGDRIEKIVEEKDADLSEKKINTVNGGLYYIKGNILKRYINMIDNSNAQGEYYLTDIVEILNKNNKMVNGYIVKKKEELFGVNTIDQLKQVEKYVQ